GVEVLGFVDDLQPVWQQTTALVAPIRSGTGTRIKIIESFARGVAVVSTTLGCDGLDVVPEEHLLVGDDPAAFAERCCRVIADPALRTRLVRAGRVLAERHHSPAAFEATVAELAGRAEAAAP
ncbi:MAG: glycosyltransferase, partial [Acidimicrobiia bacterium]|nr:glycosyltransferase [Acidimicrobiia bacterium]